MIFALGNTKQGLVNKSLTRYSARPTNCDLNNINLKTMKLMEQYELFPKENLFSYLWVANSVLYAVVMAFLVSKGWKKQRRGTSG